MSGQMQMGGEGRESRRDQGRRGERREEGRGGRERQEIEGRLASDDKRRWRQPLRLTCAPQMTDA